MKVVYFGIAFLVAWAVTVTFLACADIRAGRACEDRGGVYVGNRCFRKDLFK